MDKSFKGRQFLCVFYTEFVFVPSLSVSCHSLSSITSPPHCVSARYDHMKGNVAQPFQTTCYFEGKAEVVVVGYSLFCPAIESRSLFGPVKYVKCSKVTCQCSVTLLPPPPPPPPPHLKCQCSVKSLVTRHTWLLSSTPSS